MPPSVLYSQIYIDSTLVRRQNQRKTVHLCRGEYKQPCSYVCETFCCSGNFNVRFFPVAKYWYFSFKSNVQHWIKGHTGKEK